MERYKPWDENYEGILDDYDEDDEGDEWYDEQTRSSPARGLCGTQNWYQVEYKYEDTPEQTMADMIEEEERRNKGEEDEMDGY